MGGVLGRVGGVLEVSGTTRMKSSAVVCSEKEFNKLQLSGIRSLFHSTHRDSSQQIFHYQMHAVGPGRNVGDVPGHMTGRQGNFQSLWRTGLGRAVVIATAKRIAERVRSWVGGDEEESLWAQGGCEGDSWDGGRDGRVLVVEVDVCCQGEPRYLVVS